MGLKLITDSVADIPDDLARSLNIRIVPLQVNFGDGSYRDGVDITSEAFFEKLARAERLPTTAQVTPGEFFEVFQEEMALGNDLIVLTMSSKMSGTYNAACAAAEMTDPKRVSVFDSRTITFGMGLSGVLAARDIQAGLARDVVEKNLQYRIDNMVCKFAVDTLEYLRKGGRLSATEAFVGNLLNIKPILTVIDGELRGEDKVRGRKKAIRYIVDSIAAEGVDLSGRTVGLYHAMAPEYMAELREALEERFEIGEILCSYVGAVVGTHAGPGCVAVSYVKGRV